MTEPTYVPDPLPDGAWPTELPPPHVATRGELTTFTSRFEREHRHGPWSMGEVARRSTADLARLAGWRDEAPFAWDDALFLDLEVGTHPRGGSCLFLAGVARLVDGALVLEQLLAHGADAEEALLDELAPRLAAARELVTFGGRSFDVPMLEQRCAAWQRAFEPPRRHLDLLRAAAKVVKRRFGDQKLRTMERELLRFDRGEDLAGSQVPFAWHELSQEGSAAARVAVLRHNLLDVLALPSLAAELSFRLESPQDLDERRFVSEARVKAGKDRASLERALEDDPDSFRALLEMSRVAEQQDGDPERALELARRALENAPDHLVDRAKRRVAQLEKRIDRSGWDGSL